MLTGDDMRFKYEQCKVKSVPGTIPFKIMALQALDQVKCVSYEVLYFSG